MRRFKLFNKLFILFKLVLPYLKITSFELSFLFLKYNTVWANILYVAIYVLYNLMVIYLVLLNNNPLGIFVTSAWLSFHRRTTFSTLAHLYA